VSDQDLAPGRSEDGVGVGVDVADFDPDVDDGPWLPPAVGVDDGSRPLVSEPQLGGDLLGNTRFTASVSTKPSTVVCRLGSSMFSSVTVAWISRIVVVRWIWRTCT